MVLFKDINRSSFDQDLKAVTIYNPWLEVGRLIALKLKLKGLVNYETGMFCTDNVYQRHDRWVAMGRRINYTASLKS
jgi:hypothetical protein